jgi:hypothetical protein
MLSGETQVAGACIVTGSNKPIKNVQQRKMSEAHSPILKAEY